MPLQPTLSDPVAPSQIEKAFLNDSPVGLWPDNQNSNFGLKRKVFCDQLMNLANQLQLLYNERFVATSSDFLDKWEEDLGAPVTPPGYTVSQRRAVLQSRLKRGAFTHSLRGQVIESHINALLGGDPPVFGTQGINLGSGVTLASGLSGAASDYYTVVEDVTNFYYYVYLDMRLGINFTLLASDLDRITPAGISFALVAWYKKTGGGKTALRGAASTV